VVVSVSEQLGPGIVSEMCSRYNLPLETAEAKGRNAAIALISDALRGSRFFARSGGPFALEARRLEFDGGELSGEWPMALAVAAAFSRCYAWLHKPPEVPPQRGTKEWEKLIKRKMFEKMQAEMRRLRSGNGGDEWGIDMSGDNFGEGIDISQGWGE
jgi:hypothetical protein